MLPSSNWSTRWTPCISMGWDFCRVTKGSIWEIRHLKMFSQNLIGGKQSCLSIRRYRQTRGYHRFLSPLAALSLSLIPHGPFSIWLHVEPSFGTPTFVSSFRMLVELSPTWQRELPGPYP